MDCGTGLIELLYSTVCGFGVDWLRSDLDARMGCLRCVERVIRSDFVPVADRR